MASLALAVAFLLLFGNRSCTGQEDQPITNFACSPGSSETLVPKGATLCPLEDLERCQKPGLAGPVRLTGSPSKPVWDFGAGGDGAIRLGQVEDLAAVCFRILLQHPETDVAQLQPVAVETLLSPPLFGSAPSRLALRNVEFVLDCDQLKEWQELLCSIRLPGETQVRGPLINISRWETDTAFLENVLLSCQPKETFRPACSMAIVNAVEDILSASDALLEPSLPLVLALTSPRLDFNNTNWPADGVRITANVTLSATWVRMVSISFGLKTVLFQVDSKASATAFLSFRGCILLDLPLSYLPLDHPRRPFGILSTGIWPVYREQVAMGLYNCTIILTEEEFNFWSFWFSILISPIPAIRALGNWSSASNVQLEPSGDDFIQLATYYGRYTTYNNVRYQISDGDYTTQQRNNILQITGDPQVPPTIVFQVRDSIDMLSALMNVSSTTASEYGLYIILTDNITMPDSQSWPSGGAPIRYSTTFTTWPSSVVAFDFQQTQDSFIVTAPVVMKNTVLLNLPAGPKSEAFGGMASGLWAFNYSSWRTSDQGRLTVQDAAMVVAQQEVEYYIAATVDMESNGLSAWITASQVQEYDTANRSWVMYSSITTQRFTASNLNLTSTVPPAFNTIPVTTPTSPSIGVSTNANPSPGGVDRREVLLFAVLAITLPTALGAALVTFLWVKRRRLSRMCRSGGALGEVPTAKADVDDAVDVEDLQPGKEDGSCDRSGISTQDMTCCLRLPLQLRKAKFVNPLFELPGAGASEVVLTAVLGPSNRATPASRPLALAAAEASPETPAWLGAEEESFSTTEWSQTSHGQAQGQRPQNGQGSNISEVDVAGLAALGVEGVRLHTQLSGRSRLSYGTEITAAAELSPRPVTGLAGGGAPGRSRLVAAATFGLGVDPAAWPFSGIDADPGADADPEAAVQSLEPSIRGGGVSHGGLEGGQEQQQRLESSGQEPGNQEPGGAEVAQAGDFNPRLAEMQRLEQLRRDIGDRHLEMQHSLGWGGCGVVYKGTWKGLQVAVKTVLLQGDSKQSRQFLTEAAISASLQHANIVTTYLYELRPLDEVDPGIGSMEISVQHDSSGSLAGHGPDRMSCWKLYIVQEFCELGTLKTAIDQSYFKGAQSGQPNMTFLLAVALDVAMGLVHVHSKDVVHGDITVSNVLLQAAPNRPQGCIAKVADFGLSVKFEAGQTHHPNMYGGTPHYMAPERTRGYLSKACDIYSLGVCFWELYCGTPHWRRNTTGAHDRRYNDASSVTSSSDSGAPYGAQGPSCSGGSDVFRIPRSCPPEYSSLVLSCLSADPQRRPTAEAVVEALQRLQRRYG